MARPRPELLDLAAGRTLPDRPGDDDLVRSALEHGMGGLLWSVVSERDEPFPGKRVLARRDLATRARHRRHWSVLATVGDRLAERGIEVATIKGVASERRWYRRCGERPCVDVDLLVAPDDVARVGTIVRALQPDHRLASDIEALAVDGAVQSIDLDVDGVAIDLHFDPLKLGVATRDPALLWSRCIPSTGPDGQRVLAPDASAALVVALLHLNRDRFRSLLGFADVARLLATEAIDWAFVDRVVDREGLAVPVVGSLARVTAALGIENPYPRRIHGARAAAWSRLWSDRVVLLGDEGRIRFRKRQNWIPLLMRGHLLDTARWWWRDAFPARAAVSVRYRDVPGPYLRRLTVGRVRARAARRAAREVARVEAAPVPTARALAIAAALRARLPGGLDVPVAGSSMGRTLPSRRRVRLEAAARPRRGQIWAFCDASGQIVVHRYRRTVGDRHELRGDTRPEPDELVTDAQLIGRAVAIAADGRVRRLGSVEVLTAWALRSARTLRGSTP